MKIVRELATLAAGFAVARGYDRFRKVGGMSGVEDRLRNAGSEGGIGQQLGEMAEKIGLPLSMPPACGSSEASRG